MPVGFDVREALGDGACAFNSFILALKDIALSNTIDADADKKYALFLAQFARTSGQPATWAAFKDYVKKTPANDLQKNLSPVFRALSLQIIKDKKLTQAARHQAAALVQLQGDFHNIVKMHFGHPHLEISDVFSRMQTIINALHTIIPQVKPAGFDSKRYAQLSTQRNLSDNDKAELARLDKALTAEITRVQDGILAAWWNKAGYNEFLLTMAVNNAWAGDLELAPLAEYFDLNLMVHREAFDKPFQLHFDYGVLQTNGMGLSPECLSRLSSLELIERQPLSDNHSYRWQEIESEATLRAMLMEIPDAAKVTQFFTGLDQGKPLSKERVPENFSSECVQALLQRKLIETRAGQKGYFFHLDARDVMMERIAAVDTQPKIDAIIKAWKETYRKRETMHLENQHGNHWNALVPALKNELTAEPAADNQRIGSFLADKNVVLIEDALKELSPGWKAEMQTDKKSMKVHDGKGKSFEAQEGRLISNSDDKEIFKAMLKCFLKISHGKPLFKIRTHSEAAKNLWVDAIKEIVFQNGPDAQQKAERLVELTAPKQAVAPAVPVPVAAADDTKFSPARKMT